MKDNDNLLSNDQVLIFNYVLYTIVFKTYVSTHLVKRKIIGVI